MTHDLRTSICILFPLPTKTAVWVVAPSMVPSSFVFSAGPLSPTFLPSSTTGRAKLHFASSPRQACSWSAAAPVKPPMPRSSAPAAPNPSTWGLCSLLSSDFLASCNHKLPGFLDCRAPVRQHDSFPFLAHYESPAQFAQTDALVKSVWFMPNNTDFHLPLGICMRKVAEARATHLPGHCSCSRQRMHRSPAPRRSRYRGPFYLGHERWWVQMAFLQGKSKSSQLLNLPTLELENYRMFSPPWLVGTRSAGEVRQALEGTWPQEGLCKSTTTRTPGTSPVGSCPCTDVARQASPGSSWGSVQLCKKSRNCSWHPYSHGQILNQCTMDILDHWAGKQKSFVLTIFYICVLKEHSGLLRGNDIFWGTPSLHCWSGSHQECRAFPSFPMENCEHRPGSEGRKRVIQPFRNLPWV